MQRELVSNGSINVMFDFSNDNDRKLKDALKSNVSKYYYNSKTHVWTVYGFKDLSMFDEFIGALILGKSTKKVQPSKKEILKQKKSFWNSEEGQALIQKRKVRIQNLHKEKYQYISSKWDEATAAVLENYCMEHKQSFISLNDVEIENLIQKNQDAILDYFIDLHF